MPVMGMETDTPERAARLPRAYPPLTKHGSATRRTCDARLTRPSSPLPHRREQLGGEQEHPPAGGCPRPATGTASHGAAGYNTSGPPQVPAEGRPKRQQVQRAVHITPCPGLPTRLGVRPTATATYTRRRTASSPPSVPHRQESVSSAALVVVTSASSSPAAPAPAADTKPPATHTSGQLETNPLPTTQPRRHRRPQAPPTPGAVAPGQPAAARTQPGCGPRRRHRHCHPVPARTVPRPPGVQGAGSPLVPTSPLRTFPPG
jgi:hypothetical protein